VRDGTLRWTGTAVPAAVAAGYAWWATGLRPFTGPALVAVLGAGLAAMALGAAALPRRNTLFQSHPTRAFALLAWLAGAAGLARR